MFNLHSNIILHHLKKEKYNIQTAHADMQSASNSVHPTVLVSSLNSRFFLERPQSTF